jgi:hypothetical protein
LKSESKQELRKSLILIFTIISRLYFIVDEKHHHRLTPPCLGPDPKPDPETATDPRISQDCYLEESTLGSFERNRAGNCPPPQILQGRRNFERDNLRIGLGPTDTAARTMGRNSVHFHEKGGSSHKIYVGITINLKFKYGDRRLL